MPGAYSRTSFVRQHRKVAGLDICRACLTFEKKIIATVLFDPHKHHDCSILQMKILGEVTYIYFLKTLLISDSTRKFLFLDLSFRLIYFL